VTHIDPPPEALRHVGGGDFEQMGRELVDSIVAFAGLRPEDRVLDMGCGIGRVALPLTQFLSEAGSYEGFDVVSSSIMWCEENITTRFPSFRFRLLDVANSRYNPDGALAAETVTFPYADAEFDLAFATSLFTHLLSQACNRYLNEAARLVKSGGTLYTTWFLVDDEARRNISAGRSSFEFRHEMSDCYVQSAEVPEAVVAYESAVVQGWLESAEFEIETIRHGRWSGRTEDVDRFQDVLVARRVSERPQRAESRA
jgi:SAM-dependent methyltransferase